MKHILSFLLCILLACFTAYYVNGFGGVFIASTLIIAVILSELNMLMLKKKISFSINCDEKELSKGQKFNIKINIFKSSFLPSPYIVIKLKENSKIDLNNVNTYKISMAFLKSSKEVVASLTAKYSGEAVIEIESVMITDYLGLFTHKIKCLSDSKPNIKLCVYPNIPLNYTPTDLLKAASDVVGFDDSEEESDQSIDYGLGVPGYEHRLYVQGDPLKKVNWKLSAKRDMLLLRKDEKVRYSSQMLVLDISSYSEENIDFQQIDILIENALALVSSILMQQLVCKCVYSINNKWKYIDVFDENMLIEFQKELSAYSPITHGIQRIPDSLTDSSKSSAILLFTNHLDGELIGTISNYQDIANNCIYITTEKCAPLKTNNMWICDELYEFKQIY
ncbi:MAG: DUF58 domain-containing protein [Clostridiales bacterium]|nr:DUF58 domain-containing protein [Clostridiales bacterium]